MEQQNGNLSKNVEIINNAPIANSIINNINQEQLTIEQLSKQQRYNYDWYKLDNAGLLYALTSNQESYAVFAMSVLLKEQINPLTLQRALNDIVLRFPTIVGAVKQGVFWHYIDAPTMPLIVSQQQNTLCKAMPTDGNDSQVRITYYGNRINVEFFHTATDGTGAITFLNSLLARYFLLSGHNISHYINCKQCDQSATLDETTDKFYKIALGKDSPKPPRSIKSARLSGEKLPYGNLFTCRVVCNTEQLLTVTKSKNATVTELLGACALLAIHKHIEVNKCKDNRPVRILVPVDFRRRYGIDTMRNFAGYTFIQYNKQRQLDDVILDVKNQMRTALNDDQYFRSMVTSNVNIENNAFLRIAPLPLKKFAVKSAVAHIGDGVVNCGTLSNIGVVNAPQEFNSLIHRYDFTLGKGTNTINFAVISFNGVTTISVTSEFKRPVAAREFFTLLANTGIDVAVEADLTENIQ